MATFTTAIYDAQASDRANPSRLAAPNLASGTVEFAVVPYTLAATEAAADIIKLCVLPAGAIPVPQLSKCTCSADPGTALTVKVGTADDDDGIAASVAMTVAGDVAFTPASGTMPAALAPTPIVADSGSGNAVVYATVVTATALTANVIVYFTIAYKRAR